MRFLDDHPEVYGGGPICRVMPIAPSTCYAWKACEADPGRRWARARRDEWLRGEIQRVWDENRRQVYGAEKVWRQLNREGTRMARCTVECWLMGDMGLEGTVRGARCRTTVPVHRAERPLGLAEPMGLTQTSLR